MLETETEGSGGAAGRGGVSRLILGFICIQGFPKHMNNIKLETDRDKNHTDVDRQRSLNTSAGFLYMFPRHLLINIVFSGSSVMNAVSFT